MVEIAGKVVGVVSGEQGTSFLVKNDIGGFEKLYDVYGTYESIGEGMIGVFRVEAMEAWNDRAGNWEAVLHIINFEEE